MGSARVTVRGVLGRAFALSRRNFGVFAPATAVLVVLPAFLNGAASIAAVQRFTVPGAQHAPPPGLAGMLSGLLWWPLSVLLFCIVVRATVDDRREQPPSLRSDFGGALKLFLPVLAVTVLTDLGIGVGYALLIAPGLALQCMWYVAVPACVAERSGVFAALGRSRALTAGHRWTVFGLLLVYAAAFAAVTVLNFYGLGTMTRSGAGLGASWALQFVDTALSGVLTLFGCAVSAAAYVELRRSERGAEPAEIAEAFG